MLRFITNTVNKPQGSVLFYVGERAMHLHLIASGSIEIYKQDTNGNEIPIATFNAKSMIAETANFKKHPLSRCCKVPVRLGNTEDRV